MNEYTGFTEIGEMTNLSTQNATPANNKDTPSSPTPRAGRKTKIAAASKLGATIPPIILTLIENDIPVQIDKDGYLIGGFYGLSYGNTPIGFMRCKESADKPGVVLCYDHKNVQHEASSVSDFATIHSIIWSNYYKQEEYKIPDSLWIKLLISTGSLDMRPKK